MIDIFEVVGWLNATDASSHLTDEAKRFSRSARIVSRSDASVRRTLDSLRDVGQLSPDPLETAEISLHRAAIEYWRGWFSQTARHARDAVIAYENDDHRRAVALWMLGMAQWEILRNHKAYRNCDRARTIFQERQVFFRHSPNERDWYKNRVRQMEIELAARPEEILTWLNWFEATSLTPPAQQLVDTAQEKIRQQAYPTVYALMQDLQEVNKWSKEVYERAEVFLECGLAAYQMGNTTFAIELLKKAVVDFSPGIGNNHKQVVARCMLGAVEWMDKSKHNQATVDWVRCIDDFEQLRLRADKDNNQKKKKWYADHRAILQAALSERLSINPKGKPKSPTAKLPKPSPQPPDRYQYLVILVQGDQAIAERLIEYEHDKVPNANRGELVERAIDRLLHDRGIQDASFPVADPGIPMDRYQTLLNLVQGDQAVADRLIEDQSNLLPGAVRNILILQAINYLWRHRRSPDVSCLLGNPTAHGPRPSLPGNPTTHGPRPPRPPKTNGPKKK